MHEPGDSSGSLVGATLGHYHVTDQIGRGGMGTVYRAVDDRLGRSVAIKSLLHERGSDPAGWRRLMDEARRASRVNSPYVATVFDVLEQDDRTYIVMEYIEGRRLDAVLWDDHPGPAELTRYATEIAEALAAIHGAGVIHRDLKPGNVMITATGHVKVMDFGLALDDGSTILHDAHAETSRTTQSSPGAVAGTIAYMSPEQIRGERLDGRSDLFSFGTVLHEAITGMHPFQRDSVLATASAILHEPPAPGPDLAQQESTGLMAVAQHLLEKERDKRYASAEDVLIELGVLTEQLPKPAAKWLPWTLAALVAVSAVTWSLWPKSPSPDDRRPVVAILPFEDKTGEVKGDLSAALMADVLAASLADSQKVRALSSDRVREIVAGLPPRAPQSRVLAAVAGATPVRWLVTGSVYKEGNAYYASVLAFRPGETTPAESYRVAAGGHAAMAERAGAILRKELLGDKEPGGTIWKSTSDEAQMLEQEARLALRELRYREAIERLEKAIALDPAFVPAKVRLAEALDGAGYGARARDAADRAMRDIAGLGEAAARAGIVLEAKALEARTHGDANAEIEARRAIVAAHGDDPVAHLTLASALNRRGKYSEALAEAQLAISLDPRDPSAHVVEARAFLGDRRYDDATASMTRAAEEFNTIDSKVGSAVVEQFAADLASKRGQHAEAKARYDSAADTFSREGLDVRAARARVSGGGTLLILGELDAAQTTYDTALKTARAAGDHLTVVKALENLGAQLLARGQFDRAERALREARSVATEIENPQLLAGPTLNLASLVDYTGRHAEGARLAEQARGLARDTNNIEIQTGALVLLADVYEREGRPGQAIQAYREVIDAVSGSNAPGAPLANAHRRLADLLRECGRLREAQVAAESGLALQRASGNALGLGYALVVRGLVRADLAMYADAAKDLDAADDLASDTSAPLEDLRFKVAISRAQLASNQGHWEEAERQLASLRRDRSAVGMVSRETWVSIQSTVVAIGRRQSSEAIRHGRRAMEISKESPRDEAIAGSLLATALAVAGESGSADSEARIALDRAAKLQLPLTVARACAVLVETMPKQDGGTYRSRGSEALAAYLEAAPEDRRSGILARGDLADLFEKFDLPGREVHAP